MFNNIFANQQAQGNNGNLFQQQQMAMPNNFAQNNGLNFNNVQKPKQCNVNEEEMAMIRSTTKNSMSVSDEELAEFKWNLRDPNGNLALEIVDPKTERMRVKWTGQEFNLIMQPVQVLIEYLEGLRNFVMTVKVTNTSDDQSIMDEIFKAFGIVNKLLPIAYENGQKNYETLNKQISSMMTAQGYQGSWGNGMYNGSIGAVPNYYIPSNPGFGYQQQMMQMNPQQQMQMMQNAQQQQMMMQNAQQFNNPMQQMGAPMQSGGTMLNNNAFVQNGQPQVQPQMQQTPVMNSVPMPGVPVTPSGTQNPSMGTTTTASSKV
jgi:hypothetical protein